MKHRFGSCVAMVAALLGAPVHADDAGKCKLDEIARLPVVMDGPRASVPITVNGRATRVWLDSGAFFNFMPKAKAVELGLTTEPLPQGLYITGIGGSFTPELARIRDFGILGATLHNVEFVVGGSDVGNGFLGANLLGVWDTEFDLAKGAVNIFRESGCHRVSLAYWGAGMAVNEARLLNPERDNDHHIYLEMIVNGHSLRAMLDSGAPETMLGRRAAERIGIDLDAPHVVASYKVSGVGVHQRSTWIVRTQTIAIGGEEIRNSPIRVIDDSKDEGLKDITLGVDFLMAHHVLVSQAQRKVFLTYNGGAIFSAGTDREIGHIDTRAENMGGAEAAGEPNTADEFAGRASGRLNRGDVIGAIADYADAIRLAPTRSDLLGDRAHAYFRGGHADLAARDIDAALAITPADHGLLTIRARLRLNKGDRTGALADADAAAAATPRGSLDVMALVTLYERLGKADRGLALLDPVIDLHRDDSRYPFLLNARSWNRALANADLDRALKDANTAIRKAGPMPGLLDTRALIEYRRRDYAAAIADESRALDQKPGTAAALYGRGLARLAGGDTVGGNADIASARTIQPNIDARYADYGLAAPKPATSPSVQPAPDGDDQ